MFKVGVGVIIIVFGEGFFNGDFFFFEMVCCNKIIIRLIYM